MINKLKDYLLQENEMYLHEKKVSISKLTPVKWKKLFGTIDTLPGLIAQVITSQNTDNYYMVFITAIDIALDEVVTVVSILTELDEEYIKTNVGLDEIIEYLTKTVKLNRLDNAVKNVKSLLPNRK